LSVGSASCSSPAAVRHCVRNGDAEFCGDRTGGGVAFDAKGLKPGSSVKLSSAPAGASDLAVGPDGHMAGTVGLIVSAADLVIAVTASTANGERLTGELSFAKP
jgi:hypothetical protein